MDNSKDAKEKEVKRGVDQADAKNVVVVRNKNLSIECLPSETLVIVFEHLLPADRIRIELVNKRWKNLAKDWSWSKYKVISADHFLDCDYWTDSDIKLQALFQRCRRLVQELRFRSLCVTRTTYDLLPMLTELKHLDLSRFPMNSVCLSNVADSFPNLMSVVLVCHETDSLDGVTAILARCDKIEIFKLFSGKAFQEYQFDKLPSALKCVYLQSGFSAFLRQVTAQKIQLVVLEMVDVADLRLLSKIDFTRLRYLSLYLSITQRGFSDLLWYLSNLRGLKLDISDEIAEHFWEELCDSIATRCAKLKHLELGIWNKKKASRNALLRLADLPDLCSVRFNFTPSIRVAVEVLFDQLVLRGKLQYFHTTTKLDVPSICQAVFRCKSLTYLFHRNDDDYEEVAPLFKALDDVHKGDKPPIYKTDKRILHTNFGSYNGDSVPKHPWVIFYPNMWGPSNEVKEQICYGECSSRPTFLDLYSK